VPFSVFGIRKIINSLPLRCEAIFLLRVRSNKEKIEISGWPMLPGGRRPTASKSLQIAAGLRPLKIYGISAGLRPVINLAIAIVGELNKSGEYSSILINDSPRRRRTKTTTKQLVDPRCTK
jgi:hypothetical protein